MTLVRFGYGASKNMFISKIVLWSVIFYFTVICVESGHRRSKKRAEDVSHFYLNNHLEKTMINDSPFRRFQRSVKRQSNLLNKNLSKFDKYKINVMEKVDNKRSVSASENLNLRNHTFQLMNQVLANSFHNVVSPKSINNDINSINNQLVKPDSNNVAQKNFGEPCVNYDKIQDQFRINRDKRLGNQNRLRKSVRQIFPEAKYEDFNTGENENMDLNSNSGTTSQTPFAPLTISSLVNRVVDDQLGKFAQQEPRNIFYDENDEDVDYIEENGILKGPRGSFKLVPVKQNVRVQKKKSQQNLVAELKADDSHNNQQKRIQIKNELNSRVRIAKNPSVGVNQNTQKLIDNNAVRSVNQLSAQTVSQVANPAMEATKVSSEVTQSSCGSMSVDSSLILQKIIQELEEIKSERVSQGGKEGLPCKLSGSWTSEVGGVRLDFSVNASGTVVIGLADRTPPKPGLLNVGWTAHGYAPFSRGAPFTIVAYEEKSKQMATFIGQCRICTGEDTVIGWWMFGHNARDCRDLPLAGHLHADMFHRETLHMLQEEKLRGIAHHNRRDIKKDDSRDLESN